MSAFQAYGGAYQHDGRKFTWRCYATAPIYEVRPFDHAPQLSAPEGKKWVRRSRRKGDVEFSWLVDRWTDDFSQILLQVESPDAPERQRDKPERLRAHA